MPKFLVELEDGKKFQVEADQQPSPEEISQYLGGQTQPEKPFFDLSETASSLGRAVTSLPTTTMASLSQAWEGLENPWKRSEGYLSRRQEMQALQDELAASEAEAAASGDASTVSSAIREATPSLGFSGATLLPSLGAGAGTLALSKSPAAARGAAAATSALMAYRMAGAQFLDDAKERIDAYFQENVGRAPNEQEQAEAYQELLPLARKFGAAEAGPEALGNLALGGAGKYIRRALGGKGGIVDLASNALGKVTGTKAALAGAGALASEVGTEGVTKVEQDRIQKQFEEGIMRGEAPESVQLAERAPTDYLEGFKEVAPVTIATVGMMGAAGLGPKAISRGIQALRPKPPVEQIVEEPFMPDPAEVAKTIGESSVEQLAATGNEASAAAQADFNTILAETLGETPEPTIQPEQEAEEVEAEVTPSPEMEMPSPPQGVDMASAPVSPIITEAPIITPEEESLAAKRRADLLSAAADVAKGKKKAQVSPAVTAMVTPQPATTQENAPPQIPLEESLRQEPQDRIESREAEETIARDQLLSPAEGEKEVITPQGTPTTTTEGMVTPGGVATERDLTKPEQMTLAEFRQNPIGLKYRGRTPRYLPVGGSEASRVNRAIDNAHFQKVEKALQSGNPVPLEVMKDYTGLLEKFDNLYSQQDLLSFYNDLASSAEKKVEKMQKQWDSGEPPFIWAALQEAKKKASILRGKTTKYAVQVVREKDFQKIASETPDTGGKPIEQVPPASLLKGLFGNSLHAGERIAESFVKALGKWDSLNPNQQAPFMRDKYPDYAYAGRQTGVTGDGQLFATLRLGPQRVAINNAIESKKPVSAAAVDTYGIKLPSGYVKQGDLYVFQPQTKQAAETQTPVPLREGTGAAGVVQSEPSEGSIPEVAKVSTETESESTEKSPVTEAAIRDLEDSISKLPEKAQAKWTPEVMAKARDFYDSADRNQSRLDGLTQIQKNKVYDSLYRADRAAAAEQDRIEKAQKARDKEIEKEEREAAKKEAEMLKREEMRSKAIDSIIGKGEKQKRKFGQVTNSDAISAVAMLVSSKDIPGVLTTWWGTKGDFLRDPANQTADPEIYARIKAGELVEGFFNKGRAYVFLDGIGVSNEDMLRGEQMGVSPQVAAVRRVLLHESLVHRGIHGLPLRHRRLILNWVRQNSTPAELDDLAKLYTEYANWRNSDYQFEALAEEFLAKKVDSLTDIPKDGPMAKLIDILRQIWDFIVGYKREPTLSDLKSVLKLLKSGAEALTNDTLKDGGGVKLSAAPPSITNAYNAASVGQSSAFVPLSDVLAKSGMDEKEFTQEVMRLYDRGEVFLEGANSTQEAEQAPFSIKGTPVGTAVRIMVPQSFASYASDYTAAKSAGNEAARSTLYSERDMDIREAIRRAYEAMPKTNSVAVPIGELFAKTEELMPGVTQDEFSNVLQDLFEDNGAVLQEGGQITPEKEVEIQAFEKDNPFDELIRKSSGKSPSIGEINGVSKKFVQRVLRPTSSFAANNGVRIDDNAPLQARAMPDGSIIIGYSLPQERFDELQKMAPQAASQYTKDSVIEELIHVSDLIGLRNQWIASGKVIPFDQFVLGEQSKLAQLSVASEINVTTPEGKRASFVVVMPRAAKASRIKAEDESAQKFKEDIAAIENGSIKADFGGVQFTDFPASKRTVKPKEFYTDAAIRLVNDLQKKKNSIEDIAFSIQSPDFLESVGIENNLSAQDALTIEVRNRVNNDLRREKRPERKKVLEKMNKRLSGYWQGTGSTSGKNLGIRKHLINDPRYRWMFIKDLADKSIMDAVENVARANMDVQQLEDGRVAPQEFTDKANAAGEQAADQSAQAIADNIESSVEDDQDAIDLAAGEATLKDPEKSLYEEYKDLLREEGILARLDELDNIKAGSKASISAERRNELANLTREERAKLREKNKKRRMEILAKLLGKEEDAKTPEQKKTRAKRKKGIETLEKRAKKGKPIDVEVEGDPESSEEQVSKAEKTAQSILKGLSERYSDPLIFKEKKPNVDAMRELYKERVKQGVGPNQMTEESFVNKAVELGADEATAGILWKAAELEIDAREAMRQDKILQRKAAVGARADAQAHRIIFAKERLKRQYGFSGIESNSNKDTIIKAFQEQVKTPIAQDAFIARLRPLNVSETVARRLFTAAEREKADLEAMKKFQAEKRALEEIEMAEKKASQIIYRFEEQYRQGFKNPPEGMTGQEQRDSIIRAFRDQVKNPTSFEEFAERLAKLKVGEEVAERMFLTASRERADLIRVKNIKIAKRKVEIADKQASRLIYSTEERFRQGSKDLNESKDGDSINKAFRDQISTPVSEADFAKRLAKLNVSPDVAGRLFKTAAREKSDLEAMEAFRLLEGPDALKRMLAEINKARPGQEAPLSKQIPWREILSQKSKTVEEYRQRIFDAISANDAFKNLTDEQKSKLADLFSQAWEQKRTEILDRMLTNLINQEEAAKRLTKEGAKALREQRMKLVEDINLGILDAEEVMKRLAEKFGIKTEFTETERQKIDSLIETIQDETLNRVKRNKAAYELLKTLSGNLKIPIVKMLADYWVASVLSGMNTATSIALAVGNGAFELLSGVYRIMKTAVSDPKELPAEIAASFKAMAAFLKAFKREGRLAWQYLVTGDREFLDPSMNDVLNDLNYESIGRSTALAEKMAESDKILQKVMGIWMRSVSRLLTALDSFNAGVTKSGSLPIVLRQLDLTPEGIAKAEEAMNLQNYKDQIIRRDFGNKQPKTQREKAIIDSWAKDEMMAELDKYGRFSENANFYGQQGAMTLDPSGIGGVVYRLIKSATGAVTTGSDKFLAESQRKWKQAENGEKITQGLQLALAYFLQFGAYNAANLAGLRFARFAGNKFNQGLSFIPGIGAMRIYEADLDKSRVEAKEAFTDMIMRNQTAGFLLSIAGYMILKAIADEPDDEKRGWFFNGGWSNLTPEKKQQKLAAGQKEFTIGIGDKVYNYQNWPISSALAAIGGLSDLIRFSPEQWNEKNAASRLTSAAASGVFAATEIPALSGFQTLFGNNLSSKDPNEKKLDRFANVMAGWAGGFSPRILKDFDYLADPSLRKYETLWEKTASHIPIYRRYIGEEYYDVLGKQIEKKIYPGSREFMEKESAPEYQILGKLNSRGIWLTPANAEYRMVGKGRNRRRLTQEEADAYSLETGKGYRQMLLRYGQRALQMPTERARAFLSDKADEVRDRALKKVYRR